MKERLRAAMWHPLDPATKAEHLDMIAAAATTRSTPRAALRVRTILVVAMIGVATLGGAALAAEGAVPGELLFPVKQVTEEVRSWFDDEVVAEHRVEELDEIVRREVPETEVDERLVDAEIEVDRLEPDSQLRVELDDLRRDIALSRDVPETDLPRSPTATVIDPVTTRPTGDTKPGTTRPPTTAVPDTTIPTRDEPVPTGGDDTLPSDEPTPTTEPKRDS